MLEGREAAVQRLLAVQVGKANDAPLKGVADVVVTEATREQDVVDVHWASEERRAGNLGPVPLLHWDDQTRQLVDFIFRDLSSSVNNRPPEGDIYDALRTHFGKDEFTRAEVNTELEFAASAACLDSFGPAIFAYRRRKLDSLYRAIVMSFPFDVPNPIIPMDRSHLFPRGIDHTATSWPFSITEPPERGQRMRWLEFIERDFGASHRRFLADGRNMPEMFGEERRRISDEGNRCFYVALGAALGLHPVWLQVMNS
jgi:hypothetical protein